MKLRMWLLLAFGTVLAGGTILGFFLPGFLTHGHGAAPLDVTVRLVDRDTGQPLAGAVVAIVRWGAWIAREEFEREVAEALEFEEETRERPSLAVPVQATRSTAEPETTVHAAMPTTTYLLGPIVVRRVTHPPDTLWVNHPRHGPTVVPIPEDAPFRRVGDGWRLDLGTVRIPGGP